MRHASADMSNHPAHHPRHTLHQLAADRSSCRTRAGTPRSSQTRPALVTLIAAGTVFADKADNGDGLKIPADFQHGYLAAVRRHTRTARSSSTMFGSSPATRVSIGRAPEVPGLDGQGLQEVCVEGRLGVPGVAGWRSDPTKPIVDDATR